MNDAVSTASVMVFVIDVVKDIVADTVEIVNGRNGGWICLFVFFNASEIDTPTYNVVGQCVNKDTTGIIINGHKKIIKR